MELPLGSTRGSFGVRNNESSQIWQATPQFFVCYYISRLRDSTRSVDKTSHSLVNRDDCFFILLVTRKDENTFRLQVISNLFVHWWLFACNYIHCQAGVWPFVYYILLPWSPIIINVIP